MGQQFLGNRRGIKVNNRGKVDESNIKALRDYGLTDKEMLEIVGVIGLYTFLNYVKHLTQPALDFPIVEEFQSDAGHGSLND